jgi:hypothetical protein
MGLPDGAGMAGAYFWCIDQPLRRSYGATGLIHRIKPGEGTAIVRRLVIALAITASMLAAAPAALGANDPCSRQQTHAITLSQGKATPGSGTTATLFTFSVKYADSAGCVPSSVTVTVAGVGTFVMTGSPGNYFAGVIFTRGVRLPVVGTHAYSFKATSGTQNTNGVKSSILTAVVPATVVVSATPTPTPQPTPTPTAKPTPKPTPRPTATPSPGATPAATGTPSPIASPSGTPRPRHHASPTPAAAATPTPKASTAGVVGGPGASSAPPGGGGLPKLDGGGSSLMIAAWVTTTVGGLALFMFLAPRRRTLLTRNAAAAMPMAPSVAAPPASLAPPVTPEPRVSKERSSDDEANMPRWLRPSVQAARHGGGAGGSRSGSRRTRTF